MMRDDKFEHARKLWMLCLYHASGELMPPLWFGRCAGRDNDGPDGITIHAAFGLIGEAMAAEREVRVYKGSMLVYRAKNGQVLYGRDFWESIGEKEEELSAGTQ